MVRTLLVLLTNIGLMLGQVTNAAAGVPLVLYPASNSLQVETVTTDNRPTKATFSGSMWVSGRLILLTLQGYDADQKHLQIVLDPTPSDRTILPHFQNYTVTVIEPKNRQYLLDRLFDTSLQERLKRGELDQASVQGRFKIESFKIGLECGSQWAHAIIKEFEIKEPIQLTAVALPGSC